MKSRPSKSRKWAGKQAQSAHLRSMVIRDALRTWVIPTVAGVVAFFMFVLYNIEAVSADVSLSIIGLLALLVLLFSGLRGFVDYVPDARRLAFLAGFVVLWCAATGYPFYRTENRGTPLFSAELLRNAAPVVLPLHDKPGHYSLVVEGHFLPSQGRETRTATYLILVVGLRLGCLNHALLTRDAIAARGLRLAGWIASRLDPAMPEQEANLDYLRAQLPAPLLADFAWDPQVDPATLAVTLPD